MGVNNEKEPIGLKILLLLARPIFKQTNKLTSRTIAKKIGCSEILVKKKRQFYMNEGIITKGKQSLKNDHKTFGKVTALFALSGFFYDYSETEYFQDNINKLIDENLLKNIYAEQLKRADTKAEKKEISRMQDASLRNFTREESALIVKIVKNSPTALYYLCLENRDAFPNAETNLKDLEIKTSLLFQAGIEMSPEPMFRKDDKSALIRYLFLCLLKDCLFEYRTDFLIRNPELFSLMKEVKNKYGFSLKAN